MWYGIWMNRWYIYIFGQFITTTTATSHQPLRRFQFPHAPSPLTTLDTSPDLNSSIARHGCWTCI
ncbi:unnamed protein product [Rhodiola kirilowii]